MTTDTITTATADELMTDAATIRARLQSLGTNPDPAAAQAFAERLEAQPGDPELNDFAGTVRGRLQSLGRTTDTAE